MGEKGVWARVTILIMREFVWLCVTRGKGRLTISKITVMSYECSLYKYFPFLIKVSTLTQTNINWKSHNNPFMLKRGEIDIPIYRNTNQWNLRLGDAGIFNITISYIIERPPHLPPNSSILHNEIQILYLICSSLSFNLIFFCSMGDAGLTKFPAVPITW